MRTLDLWYARVEVDELARSFSKQASSKDAKRLERDLAKARTKDSLKAFAKLTQVVDGEPRIVSDPPLIVPVDDLPDARRLRIAHDASSALIRDYHRTPSGDRRRLVERFRYVDAAHKVVGVGSVGTRPLELSLRDGHRATRRVGHADILSKGGSESSLG